MKTKQATSDKTSDKSKRLVDVNALDFSFPLTDDMAGMLKQIGIEMVKSRIMEAPTVDAVPVVRCGECTHWVYTGEGRGDCTNRRFHLDDQVDPTMAHDEYCALGERRTDG